MNAATHTLLHVRGIIETDFRTSKCCKFNNHNTKQHKLRNTNNT